MLRTPRFIYFDLGNVLLNFSHRLAAEQMGQVASLPWQTVYKIVFENGLEDDYERGSISTRAFYNEFCRQSETRPDFERLVEAASAIFEPNLAVMPIVWNLHSLPIPMGVLSNTNEAHWNYCLRHGYRFLPPFSVFALSFQLQVMKPDPLIYERAAQLAGVAPDEIFFVDDRIENVDGARKAGFDAVHYVTAIQLLTDLGQRGVKLNI